MSWLRTLVHVLLFAFALQLVACSKPAAPARSAQQATRAVAAPEKQSSSSVAGAALAPAAGPTAWFAGRLRKLPPWGDEFRRHVDPQLDGWPTEVVAQQIEERLPAIVRDALDAQSEARRAFQDLAAEDFEGATVMRPLSLEQVFDDGDFSVLRPSTNVFELRPRLHQWAVAIDDWRAALGPVSELRVELRVTGIRALESSRYETSIDVRVAGRLESGAIQQNIGWEVQWQSSAKGEDLRLRNLKLARFEEVRARHAPFADITRAVLGKDACWREQLLRGSEDYVLREDRLAQQPFLGMHGLAIGDVNGDGLEDLYVPQPGAQPNRLFVQQQDGSFKDTAAEAGVDFLDNCGSAMLLDLDNDGDDDLAVTVRSHVAIGWNDGHGKFTQATVLLAQDDYEITSFGAADPDNDGDLDIYVCRYTKGGMTGAAPVPYYNARNGAPNFYYRNEGQHKFKDATAEVGLDVDNTRYSLALLWEDFDEDGDVDLYVVNDFGCSQLFQNDHGHFTDVAAQRGLLDQAAGMGATSADVDLDGHLDVYKTNMYSAAGLRIASQPRFMAQDPGVRDAYIHHARGNSLLRNRGDGTYEDVSESAGITRGGWGWGANFIDLNNDGLADLYVPNGFDTNAKQQDLESMFWRNVIGKSPARAPLTEEYVNAWDALRHLAWFEGYSYNGHERDYAYLNLGGLRFADISAASGLDVLDDTRVAAPIDWDDDGAQDLFVRGRSGPRIRVLHNVHPASGHFVSVRLQGTQSNRPAIGALVSIEAGGRKLRQGVHSASGFMLGASRRLLFGLGSAQRIDRLEVRWPSGARESFTDLAADARYQIVEGSGRAELVAARERPALAASAADPVHGEVRMVERIPLLERLPMRPIELPAFEGASRMIASFGGKPLLVTIAAPADPLSRQVASALGARAQELRKQGVELFGLVSEDGKINPAAGEWLARLGWGKQTGYVDKRLQQSLEVVLVEVLGPFERLPLPLNLLFDRDGNLVVVYCGELDLPVLIDDLAHTRALSPKNLTTEGLTGGRWIVVPHRDLQSMAEIFGLLGMPDRAQYYAKLAEQRSGH